MLGYLYQNLKRIVAFVVLVAVFICSITFVGKSFTNPQTFEDTIRSIDEKKVTVLGVSAAIAGSATILASVPDDSTTPLAEEMMDLSSYLALVVCILVLEKSLLTVFGAISCYFLIPCTCILLIVAMWKKSRLFQSLAIKVGILAIALLLIVPVSMKLSDYIYDINQVTIEQEIEEIDENVEQSESNADSPWYMRLWNTVTETVKSTAEVAIEGGQKALNKFVDAVSVFVIAYCAIPILTAIVFLWLFKFLFGLNVEPYISTLNPKRFKEQREKHRLEKQRLEEQSLMLDEE